MPKSCWRRRPPTMRTPAFSKLFVETEFVADVGAILATRRQRSPDEAQVWAAHLAVVEGETIGDVQFETDRARFLGRGRGIRTPIAMIATVRRSPTRPAPCSIRSSAFAAAFGSRRRTTARVAFWTLIAPSRSEVLDLADKHHDAMAFDRATTLAWTQAQVQLRHLGIGAGEAHLFQRLANRVLVCRPDIAAASEVTQTRRRRGVVALAARDLGRLADRLGPHRRNQRSRYRPAIASRPRVLADEAAGRRSRDLERTAAVLRAGSPRSLSKRWFGRIDRGRSRRAKVREARSSSCAPIWSPVEVRNLLQTAARVVLVGHRGSLSEQVRRVPELKAVGSAAETRVREYIAASRVSRGQCSSSSTVLAVSPTTDGNTSRPSKRDNGRPRPGSTSSAILLSAFKSRSRAAVTLGRSTVSKTTSPLGRTIP